MSAPYSQASEDSTSDSNERVCELCGSASRTTTAEGFSTGIGPESRSIPTCAPLWPTPVAQDDGKTPDAHMAMKRRMKGGPRNTITSLNVMVKAMKQGKGCPCRCHQLMSSVADSPARTSLRQDVGLGSKAPARVFGPSTHDSLASYDPDTSSWRTSQLCLDGGLDEFSETWPRSGMTRSGTAYRRQPLAPLTGGTASGLLPTPRTQDGKHGAATDYELSREKGKDLLHVRVARETFPTPTARDHKDTGDLSNVPEKSLLPRVIQRMEREKNWPTPTTANATQGPGNSGRDGGENLVTAVNGQLNPMWVEWLMNFPIGWTEVD